jgi:tRNA threonylcarbamoyladenosine biosynthesis protein TsaE
MSCFVINDLSEIRKAAIWLIDNSNGDLIFAFYGEMGAGKTTLIKEVCYQLGALDVVNSPTFALVNEYNTERGDSIFHFDFYRLEKPEEAFDFGFEEYISSDSYCFMEWPEKLGSLLPKKLRSVKITVNEDQSRRLELI